MNKLIAILAVVLLASPRCGDTKGPKEGPVTPESLKKSAFAVLDMLGKKDYEALSRQIEPGGTLLFSPYAYIDTERCQKLSAESLKAAAARKRTIRWGDFDATGEPIQMTVDEYFDRFVNDKAYKTCGNVQLNKSAAQGNSINNLGQVFPHCDFVEFYCEGTEQYAGMDWGALRLVFKTVGNKAFLVAIVHDQWTS